MVAKVIVIFSVLAATQAGGQAGAGYDLRAPLFAARFLGLPTLAAKSIIAQPASVSSQRSVINHVAPVGIFAAAPIKGPSVGYAGNGLLSANIFGPSAVGKAVITAPTAVSSSSVTGHVTPVGVSSIGYAGDDIFSRGFTDVSIGNVISSIPVAVSSSSVIEHVAPATLSATAPVGISSVGYAGDGLLSSGLVGTSVGKVISSPPAAVSSSSIIDHLAPLPIAAASPAGVSYLGDDILSTGIFGTLIGKTAIPAPATISSSSSVTHHDAPASVAAVPIGIPSVSYAGNGILSGPIAGKAIIAGPTTVTSRTSVVKHIAAPSVNYKGSNGNRYSYGGNGILSTGFLGTTVASTFGIDGKGVLGTGLSSAFNAANDGHVSDVILSEASLTDSGNFQYGLSTPIVGKTVPSSTKYSTVINHIAPANVDTAPVEVSWTDGNGFYGGSIGHGISTVPLAVTNGLLGLTYSNRIAGLGMDKLTEDIGLSKSLW